MIEKRLKIFLPTATQPAAAWSTQSCRNLATMIPTIIMETPMTAEPESNIGFLPTLSMINIAGKVLTKNTTPVTPVASIATVTDDNPRLTKTFVA